MAGSDFQSLIQQVEEVPRWCWHSRPMEHILRSSTSWLLGLLAKIRRAEPLPDKTHEKATLSSHRGVTIRHLHWLCFPGNTIRLLWMKCLHHPAVLLLSQERGRHKGLPTSSPEEVAITANTTKWSSEPVRERLDLTALIELKVLFTENDLA